MYVYFIQCKGKHGPIKIGKAKDANKRMENLQTANPYKLKLLAIIKCESCEHALRIEKKLHKMFNGYRLHGEWFSGKISLKRAMEAKLIPEMEIIPSYRKLKKEIPYKEMQHIVSIMAE